MQSLELAVDVEVPQLDLVVVCVRVRAVNGHPVAELANGERGVLAVELADRDHAGKHIDADDELVRRLHQG